MKIIIETWLIVVKKENYYYLGYLILSGKPVEIIPKSDSFSLMIINFSFFIIFY